MDQGNYTGVLFFDFKKAFDMVNHTILFSDMELDEKCIVVSSAYKSDIL
jgi:hypothetical protein